MTAARAPSPRKRPRAKPAAAPPEIPPECVADVADGEADEVAAPAGTATAVLGAVVTASSLRLVGALATDEVEADVLGAGADASGALVVGATVDAVVVGGAEVLLKVLVDEAAVSVGAADVALSLLAVVAAVVAGAADGAAAGAVWVTMTAEPEKVCGRVT